MRLSNSEKLVKKFFSKYKIPFVVTWNADDIISHDNPMYCGRPGAFGERGSNFIVQNCDFYLSIGTRLLSWSQDIMLKNSHQGPSLKQWLISIRVNLKKMI